MYLSGHFFVWVLCLFSYLQTLQAKTSRKLLTDVKHYSTYKQTKENDNEEHISLTAKSIDTIRKSLSNALTTIDKKDNQRVLTFYGLMLAGAVARSVSATAVHPLNVMKTMLQTKHGKMPELKWSVLSRGAGSQFLLSVPHGALNFVVTEVNYHFNAVYSGDIFMTSCDACIDDEARVSEDHQRQSHQPIFFQRIFKFNT
jgi:alcohol dehydrogenase class IV